jgi:peptide/nickel transport system substrate-binding protein
MDPAPSISDMMRAKLDRLGKQTMCRITILAAAVALALAAPAVAQKAKDTVRIPAVNPIQTMLRYDDPQPETGIESEPLFDGLLCFNPRLNKLEPLLALSWTQIDPRTIEFKLRQDVKFHDGSPLTADDIVYTLNWLADPNSNLRFATPDFAIFERAEKIDAETVRIIAREPTPLALQRVAIGFLVVPAKIHSAFEKKTDFGQRSGIGTGPYKAVSFTPGKGFELVKNDDYHHGGDCKHEARIRHVVVTQMPDEQTRLAQLVTGGLDIIHSERKEITEQLAANPDLVVTATEGLTYFYLSMDAVNRSGNAALSDLKVRQAVVQAIDRDLVTHSVLAGTEVMHVLDAPCLPLQSGCAVSRKPYPYDPAAARKLLVEAGYPDGIDVEITTVSDSRPLAEAISGELRKIGIRAKIDPMTIGAYREKQRAGKTQMLTFLWNPGLFDVAPTVALYFEPGPRNFYHDELIDRLRQEGLVTLDPEKRQEIYRRMWDRVNEQAYILPLASKPHVMIHAKDLDVPTGSFNTWGANLYELSWK